MGYSQSKVAGRAETSFPRCLLVRVVECFRELPAEREGKGLNFPSVCFWGFKPDPGDLEIPKALCDSPIHSSLILLGLSPEKLEAAGTTDWSEDVPIGANSHLKT